MNIDQHLHKLAMKARKAPVPHVNVVDPVMRTIQEPEPAVLILKPWIWTATGSVAAAIVAAVLSTSAWEMLANPLMPTVLNLMGALG